MSFIHTVQKKKKLEIVKEKQNTISQSSRYEH